MSALTVKTYSAYLWITTFVAITILPLNLTPLGWTLPVSDFLADDSKNLPRP